MLTLIPLEIPGGVERVLLTGTLFVDDFEAGFDVILLLDLDRGSCTHFGVGVGLLAASGGKCLYLL